VPRNNNTFDNSIFINCTFDKEYKPLLDALLFVVIYCGYKPRIASESLDSLQVRLDKIKNLIIQSHYSIHDLSRMEAKKKGELARFNMPFEVGIDLGCRTFGGIKFRGKKCLILDKKRYRYARGFSDLAGVDIRAHKEDPEQLVRQVRHWTCNNLRRKVRSASSIWEDFLIFSGDFKEAAKTEGFRKRDLNEMEAAEYIRFVNKWVKEKSNKE